MKWKAKAEGVISESMCKLYADVDMEDDYLNLKSYVMIVFKALKTVV